MAAMALEDVFQPKIKHRSEGLHVRSMAIDPVAVLPLNRTIGPSLGVEGCDIGGCAIGDLGGSGSGTV